MASLLTKKQAIGGKAASLRTGGAQHLHNVLVPGNLRHA